MPRTLYLLASTVIVGGLAFACSDDSGDDGGGNTPESLSFATDIYPLFVEKCGECHVSDDGMFYPGHAASNVQAAYAAVIEDGVGGQKVYERILERTASTDPNSIMPLGCGAGLDQGSCLTTEQHDLIQEWVDQGAPP